MKFNMADSVTLIRCALVWFVCALFLLDGGRFVRAQESAPSSDHKSNDSEEAEDGSQAARPDQYAAPSWYDPDGKFTDENRMLFVRTKTVEARLQSDSAREILLEESVKAVNAVLPTWLSIPHAQEIRIDQGYVESHLVFKDRIAIKRDLECETLMQAEEALSGRAFYCGYAQLYLDDDFKSFVLEQSNDLVTRKRLLKSGLVGGSIIALLAVAFGYLKMETATRGFYSRRLQTGSMIVAFALLLLFYWFGQQLN